MKRPDIPGLDDRIVFLRKRNKECYEVEFPASHHYIVHPEVLPPPGWGFRGLLLSQPKARPAIARALMVRNLHHVPPDDFEPVGRGDRA